MTDLELLDWRRRVAETYRLVRAEPDPARGHAIWRDRRDDLFATHPASPLDEIARTNFAGIPYLPYDPALRFEAEVEEVEEEALSIPTESDGVIRMRRCGRVELESFGRLDVWWIEGYGGGVFLPVADPGPGSYPGGRYVLDTVKGADLGATPRAGSTQSLVVDLNFSYNPSCAYDPRWSCPLAPPGNRLDVAVEGGEIYQPKSSP